MILTKEIDNVIYFLNKNDAYFKEESLLMRVSQGKQNYQMSKRKLTVL